MKIFLYAVIACTCLNVSFAQSTDELQVRKILSEQTLSWNQGNLNDFMKGYWQSDSLQFIGKSGLTYGWKQALNNYIKNYPDTSSMGKLSFESINAKQLSHEYYFVIGKWFLTRSMGNLNGHFSLLFRKIRNKWVIIADHSS